MGICLGALLLVCLSVPFVYATKRRFEECLPVVAIVSIFFLYVFGLLGILRIAVPALAAVALVSAVGSGFLLMKKKKTAAVMKDFFTPGFCLFVVFALFVPFLCRELRFYRWDEFSHWGLAAKDMYYYDALSYRSDSFVTMWGYPPFITLFQYFFLKLSGSYSEPVVYAAQNLMYIILLLPLAKRISWKNWAYLPLLAVILWGLPLFLFPSYWYEIYIDCLLGIALAYPMMAYFCDARKDWFSLCASCLGICFLIMLKNIGLEYSVIPLGVLLADYLFVQRKELGIQKLKIGKRIACAALCLLLVFGARGAYDIALIKNGKMSTEVSVVVKLANAVSEKLTGSPQEAETESDAQLQSSSMEENTNMVAVAASEEAAPVFGGLLKYYQLYGLQRFVYYWHHDMKLEFGPFSVSYWTLFVLLIAAGLLLLWLLRDEPDIRSIRVCVIGSLIGFWVYALITVAGMLLVFNERHVTQLSSFPRYISSCYLAILFIYLALLLQRVKGKQFLTALLAVFCFALTAISPRDLLYQVGAGYIAAYESEHVDEALVVDTLSPLDADADKVAFVSQNDDGEDLICSQYYVMPLRLSACIGWNFIEDPAEVNDLCVVTTAEQWEEKLMQQGYTHVYLYQTDAYFNETFASLFENVADLVDNALFEIRQTESGIVLERCN